MSFKQMDSATYLAGQVARALTRSLQVRAATLGFSPGQLPVLVELWTEDGQTQKQLLDRVGIEQATMANTLSRMQRDGLIERRPHPTDRRAQLVHLTQKGRGLEEEAIRAAQDADDALFSGFKRFERELLLEFMRKIIENARKEL